MKLLNELQSLLERVDWVLLAATTAGLLASFLTTTAVYRIWFHPLSKIPGPKLAAATWLVEFYYNHIKQGQYYKKIEEWHKVYGPVIRITPHEVHVNNPDTYSLLYKTNAKVTKDPLYYQRFAGDINVLFFAKDTATHRSRRDPLNNYFSKKSVTEFEAVIVKHIDRLCQHLKQHAESAPLGSQKPIDLHYRIRCIVLDIFSDYAFGKSFSFQDSPNLGKDFFDMIRVHMASLWLFRMMTPSMVYRITHLPPFIALKLDPSASTYVKLKQDSKVAIKKIRDDPKADDLRKENRTVFYDMLHPHDDEGNPIPPKSLDDLSDEAYGLTVASSDTTGNGVHATLLGILSSPDVYAKLKDELRKAFPTPESKITWTKLEKIPYMVACIKEGLRISCGVIGRMPRIVEEPNFQVLGHHIPRGFSVTTSNYMMLRNPAIYEDPHDYKPGRWLDEDGNLHTHFDKYFVPFGKDSRHCIGMYLAQSELYLSVAHIVRRFDMKIAEDSHHQSVRDLDYIDCFVSMARDVDKASLKVFVTPSDDYVTAESRLGEKNEEDLIAI
ncbi:Cytochrome P450 monooxygenase [Drechslerella dactyloides]|uniref:Cytochrome P450 monooxygenase n=1 Tax=Drechslerella dactyloides TaxID=74499 RepID=A0AAD6J1E2_DREDA|nr:Cytochrome P450 monooxygenase [Drechslerella dactyloides]